MAILLYFKGVVKDAPLAQHMEIELFQKLGISLGLGLLVGLQRQHEKSELAGIRTFPLITLFGSVAALLAQDLGGWVIAAGFISLSILVAMANYMKSLNPHFDPGLTTEASALLMFGVGAYMIMGSGTVAIAVGATTAVLLHLKDTLHRIVSHIGEKDLKAIMQFVVILLIILPVLPNETYGPYDVLNPHNIWLMVVLIVGISLLGYFVYKIFGEKAGTILGGILGGLISSTATAVSYAKRTKGNQSSTSLAAIVIFIATIVSIARIIGEVVVVASETVAVVVPPLAALFVLMVVIGGISYLFSKKDKEAMPEQSNPAQFKTALVFGLVYALVILATAFAKDQLGSKGLFIVAIISGLTDVDAITLSTSRLMNIGDLDMQNGWRVILVAALSNLVFKGALVGVLGSKSVFGRVAILFGISLVGGLLILWWWPSGFSLAEVL